MRILGSTLLSLVTLTLAGCSDADAPAGDPGDAPVDRALPDFSVVELLGEVPASVWTGEEFELRAGDLLGASIVADVPVAESAAEAPAWLAALAGVGEDPQVHVPLTLPLAPRAPAAMVEEDLHWSVLDVDQFVSYTSRNAVTTVVVGDVDESTLADLPEAGGVRSAGEGADLEDGLEHASPARPTGVPLRMVARDGWLISSPYTPVVREWRGRGPTLADLPALRGMAQVLDERDVYSAYATTGVPLEQIKTEAIRRVGDAVSSLPEFDVYAIGWSSRDDGPLVSVVYHDTDGRGLAETARRARERWSGATSRGRPMSSLVSVEAVDVVGDDVVVDLRPARRQPPDVVASLADYVDLPFWTP